MCQTSLHREYIFSSKRFLHPFRSIRVPRQMQIATNSTTTETQMMSCLLIPGLEAEDSEALAADLATPPLSCCCAPLSRQTLPSPDETYEGVASFPTVSQSTHEGTLSLGVRRPDALLGFLPRKERAGRALNGGSRVAT
jgi:hypothetical protein